MYHQPRSSIAAEFERNGGSHKKTLQMGSSSFQPSPGKYSMIEKKDYAPVSEFERYLDHARQNRYQAPEGVFHHDDSSAAAAHPRNDGDEADNVDFGKLHRSIGPAGEGEVPQLAMYGGLNDGDDHDDYQDFDDDNGRNGNNDGSRYRSDIPNKAPVTDYNKFHRYPSPRAVAVQPKEKILSLGVTNVIASPRADFNEDEDKKKRHDKNIEYQKKLLADQQQQPIESSRKPYVRKSAENDPNERMTGFMIGGDRSAGNTRSQKRAAQERYNQQLQEDKWRAEVEPSRKPMERRPITPQLSPGEQNGIMQLGSHAPQEAEKRRLARELQERNRDTVLSTISSPVKPRYGQAGAQQGVHVNATEQMKFENASYKAIGEHEVDPTAARQRKKAMQANYLSQLLRDTEGLPKQKEMNRGNYSSDIDGYVDRTGWTGLNIGGPSLDMPRDSANPSGGAMGSPLGDKYLKQMAYKRQLDQQRLHAADLALLERKQRSQEPVSTSNLPF